MCISSLSLVGSFITSGIFFSNFITSIWFLNVYISFSKYTNSTGPRTLFRFGPKVIDTLLKYYPLHPFCKLSPGRSLNFSDFKFFILRDLIRSPFEANSILFLVTANNEALALFRLIFLYCQFAFNALICYLTAVRCASLRNRA